MSTVMEELPAFQLNVPLRADEHGGIRVGKTRIQLESLVWAIRKGETAQQMLDSYPALTAVEIHAVVAWCLSHPNDVNVYMARREREATELRYKIEQAQGSNAELKAKLLERLATRGSS